MSETPAVGQVRQRYAIDETTDGAGLTEHHHLGGVTSEAWTGTEWVDVRELVLAREAILRVEAYLDSYAYSYLPTYEVRTALRGHP